jgi:hypothetical protein
VESEPGSVSVRTTLPNAKMPLQWVRNNKRLNMEFSQQDD